MFLDFLSNSGSLQLLILWSEFKLFHNIFYFTSRYKRKKFLTNGKKTHKVTKQNLTNEGSPVFDYMGTLKLVYRIKPGIKSRSWYVLKYDIVLKNRRNIHQQSFPSCVINRIKGCLCLFNFQFPTWQQCSPAAECLSHPTVSIIARG